MGTYVAEGIYRKKERRYIVNKSKLASAIIPISGAKNSALPVLIASSLINNEVLLSNIPQELNDVKAMFEILKALGSTINIQKDKSITIKSDLKNTFIKQDIASKTRYSSLLIGVLLSKFKYVEVPYPGGCAIGDERPIDIHLNGFKKLGAEIDLKKDKILLKTKNGLQGTKYLMKYPSVGATENLLIGACFAKGTTILDNCACEPEISDLAFFLNTAGAQIEGINTRRLVIEGVDQLKSCQHSIIPDRIEIGTFMGLATTGKIKMNLAPVVFEHVEAIVEKYREIGVKIINKGDTLEIDATGRLKPVNIATDVYPAVPTDMQPIFSAVLASVEGKSTITETVYKNRFAHIPELAKLGATIHLDGQKITIDGNRPLKGSTVYAHDLRTGASLLIAASIAEGKTEILNVQQIERGYSTIINKLRKIGFDIKAI